MWVCHFITRTHIHVNITTIKRWNYPLTTMISLLLPFHCHIHFPNLLHPKHLVITYSVHLHYENVTQMDPCNLTS